MAITKISDVVVPEVFSGYLQEQRLKTNRLVQSGAVVMDAFLGNAIQGGGLTFQIPSFKAVDTATENVSSDDETSLATVNKITTTKQIATRLARNGAWGSADLTSSLAGEDPVSAIVSQVANFQMQKRQQSLINILNGLFSTSGVLNSTHLSDVSGGSDITSSAVIDALAPHGDQQMIGGTVLVVHSTKYRVLQKANLITFQPTNAQDIGFGTYLGLTLLVDDDVPVAAGPVYTSYILKAGSIAMANGADKVPVELNREPLEGDGGGVEYLITRDQYTFHVYGTAWTGTPVGATPTNAELATVGNWSKVYTNNKEIGVIALLTD